MLGDEAVPSCTWHVPSLMLTYHWPPLSPLRLNWMGGRMPRRARLPASPPRTCPLSAPETLEQRPGERGPAPTLFVLEVRVHALPAPRLPHARRPGIEFGGPIVRPAEAQIAEGRRRYDRCGERLAVGNAERGAVAGKKLVGLVPEPARVAELEGGAHALGQLVEEGGEPLGVEAQVGRQLEEQGTELLAEGGGELAEALDELARVAEPELVGDALRGLER